MDANTSCIKGTRCAFVQALLLYHTLWRTRTTCYLECKIFNPYTTTFLWWSQAIDHVDVTREPKPASQYLSGGESCQSAQRSGMSNSQCKHEYQGTIWDQGTYGNHVDISRSTFFIHFSANIIITQFSCSTHCHQYNQQCIWFSFFNLWETSSSTPSTTWNYTYATWTT